MTGFLMLTVLSAVIDFTLASAGVENRLARVLLTTLILVTTLIARSYALTAPH